MRIPERIRVWRPDRWMVVAWAIAVVPVVVATVRAVRRGWLPIGDNALVAIRAHDVFTSHHPLLGTWSSASLDAGMDLNHPGPLLFDSVAPTVKLFGGHGGLAVGVMIVNILAITTTAVFAWRRGGRPAALTMLVAATVVGFVMGSELLFDPWNPHIVILACLALLVCAWGVAVGDRWALPVYLAIGSYCMQTHLGYAYLVPGLLLASFVVGWVVGRLVPGSFRWPSLRTWGITAAVVLVLWSQPFVEQFFGSGEGNLSRILGARGSHGAKIGLHLAVRLLASVLTWVPWALRRGFVDAVPHVEYASPGVLGPVDVAGGVSAVVLLMLVAAVLVALGVAARRRRDVVSLCLLGTVCTSMVLAFGSMVVMPIGPLGLTPHQMRWLWPITAFLWMSVVFVAWRVLALGDRANRAVAGALVVLASLVALANLPTYVQAAGPATRAGQIPSVAVLDAQLAPLEGMGTVFFDTSNTPLLDNYTVAIMAELQRRGVPFLVSDSGLVRQLGNARRYHQGAAKVRLQLLFGLDAVTVPDGRDRVALYTQLTPAELDEFDVLAGRIAGGASLTAAEQVRYADLLARASTGSVAVVISPLT
ncbi:MAG: hypothetical protein WCI22_05265 [Actinomycetota bacterium]